MVTSPSLTLEVGLDVFSGTGLAICIGGVNVKGRYLDDLAKQTPSKAF